MVISRMPTPTADLAKSESASLAVMSNSSDRLRSDGLESARQQTSILDSYKRLDHSVLNRIENGEALVGVFKAGRNRMTSGIEVQETKKLLNLLIDKGFIQGEKLNISSNLEGVEGKKFEALVNNFQRTYNRKESNPDDRVSVDGLVGKDTLFAMQAAFNNTASDLSQNTQSAAPKLEPSSIPGYVRIAGTDRYVKKGLDNYDPDPYKDIRQGAVKFGGSGITQKEIATGTATPSVVYGYEISRFQDSMNKVLLAEGLPTIKRTGYVDDATKEALAKLKDIFVYEEKLMPYKGVMFSAQKAGTEVVNLEMFVKVESRAQDPKSHIELREKAEFKHSQQQLAEQLAVEKWAKAKLVMLEKAGKVYSGSSRQQGSIDVVAKDYPGSEAAIAQMSEWSSLNKRIDARIFAMVRAGQIGSYDTTKIEGQKKYYLSAWIDGGHLGLGMPGSAQANERQATAKTDLKKTKQEYS